MPDRTIVPDHQVAWLPRVHIDKLRGNRGTHPGFKLVSRFYDTQETVVRSGMLFEGVQAARLWHQGLLIRNRAGPYQRVYLRRWVIDRRSLGIFAL